MGKTKRIAIWMAVLMFMMTFQGIEILWAAENPLNFIQRERGIVFGTNEYTQDTSQEAPSLSDSQAAIEWQIGQQEGNKINYQNGEYTLAYDIPKLLDSDKSRKIQFKIHMGKEEVDDGSGGTTLENNPQAAVVEVQAFEEGIPLTGLTFTYAVYEDGVEKIKSVTADKYSKTLDLRGEAFTWDKELSLDIGDIVTSLHIKQGKVQFVTAGIPKGYFVPFTLKREYEGITTTAPEIIVFKGLNVFSVDPQHLEDASLANKEIIVAGETDAGSKPGVKVSIGLPKVLDEGTGHFVPLDNTLAKQIVGTLTLQEEFATQNSGETVAKQITFKMEDGSNIYEGYDFDTSQESLGTVLVEDTNYVVYLAKDKVASSVVEWENLKTGIMLQTTLTLKEGLFDLITNKTVKPNKMGHTYIAYEALRVGINDVAFEVTPYNITGPVTYVLQENKDNSGIWINGPSIHYKDGSVNEKITLTTTRGLNSTYRVVISLGEKDLSDNQKDKYYSQILKYDPNSEAAPIDLPEIVSVDNVYVVPARDVNLKPTPLSPAIGFDLTWRAPTEQDLRAYLANEGTIYYELYFHEELTAEESDTNEGNLIKIVKVSLQNNQIYAQVYKGDTGYEGKEGLVTYDNTRNTFTIPNVKLKMYEQEDWQGFSFADDYKVGDNYPAKEDINEADFAAYNIPAQYYLSMQGVYDPKEDGKRSSVSQMSQFKSLALDRRYEVIPTLDTVKSEALPGDETGGRQVYFNPVDLSSYISYMLDPVALSLDEKANATRRVYEIYLYQEMENKQNEITSETLKGIDLVEQVLTTGSGITLNADQKKRLKTTPLRFDLIDEDNNPINTKTLKVEGLDPNQVYYMQVRVRLEIFDGEKNYEPFGTPRYSLFSKIHSFTTQTKPIPPTPDEQVPPTPVDFFILEQENNTSVELGWEPPELTEEEEKNVHYEMIRTKDTQIDSNEVNRTKTMKEILAAYDGLMAYKTKVNGVSNIHRYENGNWEPLDPVQTAANLRLLDNTLEPNAIYYYYIRTVNVIKGEEIFSDWISVPVTTSPVGRPIYLKIEDKEDYSHDTKKETVISFWAPIPEGATIPDDYEFEIAVKGPKDETFVLDYKAILVKEEKQDEYYTKYVYRIEDLKPGSRYDIKVRIKDKTKDLEEGESYPTSLYSDQVSTRTDYDEEDAEKDNKYEEYLKKYDQAVERLRRKPYWSVESGVYKYRQTYLQTELGVNKEYLLINEEDRDLYYYMPASLVSSMNGMQTALVIEVEGVQIYLRPELLSEELEEIQEAIKQAKERKIEDYYIGIEVDTNRKSGKINGEEVLSPEIEIMLEVIYLEEEDRILEADIMDELNDLIIEGREDVIDELEYHILEKGRLEEDRLQEIIEEVIEEIEQRHEQRVERILEKVIGRTKTIEEIQKPLLITLQTEAYQVGAYYYNRAWESLYTFYSKEGFSVEGQRLGTYIFTGKEQISEILPVVPGATNLITKYQLADIFDVEDTEKMEWYTTKQQVYASVARILGAQKGVDAIEFLKLQGVQGVNRLGVTQAIRKDEALYIIMQAYEKIHYKKVASLFIQNKQSVQNIEAFQPQYRAYVYAAVQLDVIKPMNNKIQPSEGILVKDILQMFAKIQP